MTGIGKPVIVAILGVMAFARPASSSRPRFSVA